MTDSRSKCIHVSLSETLTKGPPPVGNLAIPIFSHGTLEAELYRPEGEDRQQPHTRDEVYVIAAGSGYFYDGETRLRVESGSFIFVPAGGVHRFEEFSEDFAVWVFFYGPEGGEACR